MRGHSHCPQNFRHFPSTFSTLKFPYVLRTHCALLRIYKRLWKQYSLKMCRKIPLCMPAHKKTAVPKRTTDFSTSNTAISFTACRPPDFQQMPPAFISCYLSERLPGPHLPPNLTEVPRLSSPDKVFPPAGLPHCCTRL